MLDVRLDQMPLYIPPLPPLVSPLTEGHHRLEPHPGSSEAAAVYSKALDPAYRLPELIPFHSLASLQSFSERIPSTLLPFALDSFSSTSSSDKNRLQDSSFDIPCRLRPGGEDSAPGAAPSYPSPYLRPGPGGPVAQPLKVTRMHPFLAHAAACVKTSSPSPSSSSSASSSLSSPLPRNGCLSERRPSQRQSSQHSRRGSVSPDRPPWRPFPSPAATEALPALLSPFHDPAFRGGSDSNPGGLCPADFADRTFYKARHPPFATWSHGPSSSSSLQMSLSDAAAASSALLRFAPFAAAGLLAESAPGIGQVLEPMLLPAAAHRFKYQQLLSLPNGQALNEDTYCRATSPILDHRSSPGKELTSKPKKKSRVKDRQEVTSAVGADSAARERVAGVKKTASTQTQTQLAGFPSEGLPLPPPPYHTTHDTIKLDRLSTSMAPLHTPPYHHHHHHHTHTHIPPPPPFTHNGFHQGSIPLPPPPPPPHPSHPHPHPARAVPLISAHPASTPSPASPTSHSSSTSSTSPPSSSPSSHKSKIPKAPPLYTSRSPPPQYAAVARSPADVQHAPLNLSLSSQAPPPSSPTTPTHPSVISCGSTAPPIDNMAPDKGGITDQDILYHHRKIWSSLTSDESRDSVSQDEAIEEHFRRSLGQKYAGASSPKQTKKTASSPTQMTPTPPSTTTAVPLSSDSEGVSITGSVDDHFARALGNQMWTAIKAKSEPSTPEASPDTVDAHFAKALGASMWRKIQAKVDEVDSDLIQPPQPLHHHHHHHHHHHLQQQQHQSPSSSSPTHTQVAT